VGDTVPAHAAPGDFIVGSNGQYITGNTLKKLGNWPRLMVVCIELSSRKPGTINFSARLASGAASWCRARYSAKRGG
jgi:hypothetical protein